MISKWLWLFLLAVLAGAVFNANAEGPEIDPRITGQAIVTCNLPITRADGSPLLITEIATINFYVSSDKVNWQPAGTSALCNMTYDLTTIADGQYYYTASVTDTGNRESTKAIEGDLNQYTAWVVKRIAAPDFPTGFAATFN